MIAPIRRAKDSDVHDRCERLTVCRLYLLKSQVTDGKEPKIVGYTLDHMDQLFRLITLHIGRGTKEEFKKPFL